MYFISTYASHGTFDRTDTSYDFSFGVDMDIFYGTTGQSSNGFGVEPDCQTAESGSGVDAKLTL
jgi:hypothetical protein